LKKKITKIKPKKPVIKKVVKAPKKSNSHRIIQKHVSQKQVEHIPLRPKLEKIHIKQRGLTKTQKWVVSGVLLLVVIIVFLAFFVPSTTFVKPTTDENILTNLIDTNLSPSNQDKILSIEEFQNISLALQQKIYIEIKEEQKKVIEPHYQELNLNIDQINSCIYSNDYTRTDVNIENSKILLKIQKDTYLAPILGIVDAPGIFINGYYLSGNLTYSQIKEGIDFALADKPIVWNYESDNYQSNMTVDPSITIIYNEDHELIKNKTLEYINYLKTSDALTPELRSFFVDLFKELSINYYSYSSTKGINLIEALDLQVIPVIYLEGDISKIKTIAEVNNNELFTYLFIKTDAGGYIFNQKIAYDILVTSKIDSVHQLIDYSLISDKDDYVIGSKDAKVTLHLFSNYDCQACYGFEKDNLDKIMQNYVNTNKVRIVKKDFIVREMSSLYPAIFARCAQEQNKYLEANKLLFDLSPTLGTDGVVQTVIDKYQSEIDALTVEYQKIIAAQQK